MYMAMECCLSLVRARHRVYTSRNMLNSTWLADPASYSIPLSSTLQCPAIALRSAAQS